MQICIVKRHRDENIYLKFEILLQYTILIFMHEHCKFTKSENNPSHFTNQPYIKMLFVLFWSYRLISYELDNSSYCACIIQVVVVSETDMGFFLISNEIKLQGNNRKLLSC